MSNQDDKNREGRQAMKVLFWAMLLSLILAILTDNAEAQQIRHWSGQGVNIELNHSDAPANITLQQIEKYMRYAAWSWTQRTGLNVAYAGTTASDGVGQTGKIVVRWEDAFYFASHGRDFFTYGYTVSTFYSDSLEMLGAEIVLNSTILNEANKNLLFVIIHEVEHALGFGGHSDNQHDVMCPVPANGWRYAPSAYYIEVLPYADHSCHVELTLENDLYIPMGVHPIDGPIAALLVYQGDFRWKLAPYVVSSGGCSTITADEFLTLEFSDVRSMDADYSNVILKFEGDDVWSLEWAE